LFLFVCFFLFCFCFCFGFVHHLAILRTQSGRESECVPPNFYPMTDPTF
jgi:hypothetical protein